MRRHTDTSGVGQEVRERTEQVKFLKSIGYRLRKVSGEPTYWMCTAGKPNKITYDQLRALYEREKVTAQDGYTRLIVNKKSMRKGDMK